MAGFKPPLPPRFPEQPSSTADPITEIASHVQAARQSYMEAMRIADRAGESALHRRLGCQVLSNDDFMAVLQERHS